MQVKFLFFEFWGLKLLKIANIICIYKKKVVILHRQYFKVSIMDNFTAKKYVEHVLYILNKAGGLDYYRLFKIMYFAQRAYLKEYGLSIFSQIDSAHYPMGRLLLCYMMLSNKASTLPLLQH